MGELSTSSASLFINDGKEIDNVSINSSNERESNSLCPPNGRMRHWYSYGKDGKYMAGGSLNADVYRKSFEKHFGELKEGDKIMELGCSSGRMIRWFEPEASRGVDVWGCDIDGPAIAWAQQNLPSNLNFFMNTTAPHLPFRDNSFNFIFAESVFTHIAELADAWLLELARVMNKDRGLAILSINDEYAYDEFERLDPAPIGETGNKRFTGPQKARKLIKDLKEPLGKLTFTDGPWLTGVWYSNEFILSRLNKIFNIIEIIPKYHGMYQTAYLLSIK